MMELRPLTAEEFKGVFKEAMDNIEIGIDAKELSTSQQIDLSIKLGTLRMNYDQVIQLKRIADKMEKINEALSKLKVGKS